MRKIYLKLAASVLSVLLAFTMIIGASYAWMTLSNSPAVNGINVSIAGGNTILLAPDMTETITDENGRAITVHYPGAFDNYLNLSQYETYDYLNEIAALKPASTADGVHWMLPAYDEETGSLKDISEFIVDSRLLYANQTTEANSAYAYLDFWVVSPGAEYDLRVAMDTKSGEGSFLIELPQAEETADGGYGLSETSGHVESIARVGFLVNPDRGNDWSMNQYSRSDSYDKRYKSLKGVYHEPGELMDLTYEPKFIIYEPNGTSHPFLFDKDGAYIVTSPLGYDPFTKKIEETDVSSIVAVQKNSSLKMLEDEVWLEEIFQASIAGKDNLTAEKANAIFYQDYLGGQIASYVSAGAFFESAAALHAKAAENNGIITAEELDANQVCAGATGDVIITGLERNTPQRIRMYIWLEGQDADCVNAGAVPAAGFALGIELSGATK